MFEIGWTEMLVIAVVMIVIVGPKDLPKMLRAFGRTTAKLRSMAGDFQRQFNDALKEAELDDVKKSVDALKSLNPANEIKKQLNPFEKAASDVRAGLDTLKPKPAESASVPTSTNAVPAEPLKGGAAPIPGETAAPATQAAAIPVTGAEAPATVATAAPKKPRAPRKAAEAKTAETKAPAKASAKAPAKASAKSGVAVAKPKTTPRKKKSEGTAT